MVNYMIAHLKDLKNELQQFEKERRSIYERCDISDLYVKKQMLYEKTLELNEDIKRIQEIIKYNENYKERMKKALIRLLKSAVFIALFSILISFVPVITIRMFKSIDIIKTLLCSSGVCFTLLMGGVAYEILPNDVLTGSSVEDLKEELINKLQEKDALNNELAIYNTKIGEINRIRENDIEQLNQLIFKMNMQFEYETMITVKKLLSSPVISIDSVKELIELVGYDKYLQASGNCKKIKKR